MSSPARYMWFDLIRGLAALAVCASHLRAALFTEFPNLLHPTLLQRAFYLISGLGHQSVMIFFVLSGFFVGGSILRKSPQFDAVEYLLTRLTRLWVVLIPALLLTLGIHFVLSHWFPDILAGTFYSQSHSGPTSDGYSVGVATFVCNLAFQQTVACPVYGVNGPLWSLSNEFWYYLLFPMCAAVAGAISCSHHLLRVALALLVAICLYWLPIDLSKGYLVWLMGSLLWLSTRLTFRAFAWMIGSSLLIFLMALVNSKTPFLGSVFAHQSDLWIGASFTFFAFTLLHLSTSRWERWLAKPSYWISEFSYSLYLTHFPLVLVLAGLLTKPGQQYLPDGHSYAIFVLCLLMLMAIGFGFYWLFERNTVRLKRWITSRLAI